MPPLPIMKIDASFAEELINKALKSGADQAEVYMRSSKNLSVEVKDCSVDALKSSVGFGYSLRVIRAGRLGFSYATAEQGGDSVVSNAVEAAKYADEDRFLGLPEPAGPAADVEIFDPRIRDLNEDEAINKVMDMERAVYAEDRRISRIRKVSGSFTVSETIIMNSRSINVRYESTACSAQATAIAEQGDESRIGWEQMSGRFLEDVIFAEVGRNAATRAVRLLGSQKMSNLKASVILDNSTAGDFLGILASALSSEAVQKGRSLFAGRLGSRVISPRINIIDSGLLGRRLGSAPIDGEGTPSREKMMVQEGVLRTYLYNTYTAKKEGRESTGNAVRGGFGSLPSVGITNMFLSPAREAEAVPVNELFRAAGSGLYVVDVMGLHTANPVSGDFSVGVAGILIENGEEKYPVSEAVISGNILDLFDKIEGVGDDLRFYGNVAAPSLLISGVDISA